MNNKFLTPHVKTATHESGNILDLVIFSEDDLVSEVELCGKVGKSDHDLIKYDVNVNVARPTNTKKSRNFRRARIDEMKRMMHKDWDGLMDGKDVNEIWALLKKLLEDAISQHVPMRKNRRTDEPKWLDAEMRKKIREKWEAWKNWKNTGRATDKAVYTKTERD